MSLNFERHPQELAAEQGLGIAQTTLGLMYHNGEGVTKNSVQAVKWWSKAAEQGYEWERGRIAGHKDNWPQAMQEVLQLAQPNRIRRRIIILNPYRRGKCEVPEWWQKFS